MTRERKKMWVEWGVATSIAAMTMMTYIHGFIYPRTEGEKLETQVAKIETQYREDLKDIHLKIDAIYGYLIQGKREVSSDKAIDASDKLPACRRRKKSDFHSVNKGLIPFDLAHLK